jgi:uncharacterized membrane protein
MSADAVREIVERYLAELRSALGRLPDAERDDVVAEIRSHVLERIGPEANAASVREVLQAVGEPRELAAQYATQALLRRAVRSRSPWLLLRTTFRWATTGIAGVIAFLLTVTGYGAALVFLLCAFLKPFLPAQIGLWLGSDAALTLGYWNGRLPAEAFGMSLGPPGLFCVACQVGPRDGPLQDVLGVWLIPISIVAGMLCAVVTTYLVRRLIGRFGLRRRPDAGVPSPAATG